jgi:ribosome-associated heat shock protein Hsp15
VTEADRQRVDVWLHCARLSKTRAAAARVLAEGGLRLMRNNQSRRLEKASAELCVGDVLVGVFGGRLRSIRVLALARRRGPAAKARALYAELDADLLA